MRHFDLEIFAHHSEANVKGLDVKYKLIIGLLLIYRVGSREETIWFDLGTINIRG